MISIGIKTRRLVHTHKLTAYYIHCGDTFLRCIFIALNCVWLWQKPNLSLKGDTVGRNFYMIYSHSLITQKNIRRRRRGMNWDRTGILLVMKQQRYHLRYVTYHLHGEVDSSRALIQNTKGIHTTKWPT